LLDWEHDDGRAGLVGKLIYGGRDGYEVEIDDRALAHLKVAVFAKLRRNESFSFSWESGSDDEGGRHSIWVSPASMIHFYFYGTRPPVLNRTWLKQLISSANDGDLRLIEEPVEDPAAATEASSRGRW